MTVSKLDVRLRNDGRLDEAMVVRTPFSLEHVFTSPSASYDFKWNGDRAYLALHDIVLKDGEMSGSDVRKVRERDLRRRMTFLPQGVDIEGWSSAAERANSFTALCFDQAWMMQQVDAPDAARAAWRPAIYFQSRSLKRTMEKLGHLARSPVAAPKLAIENLVLVAGAELLRAVQVKDRLPLAGLGKVQIERAIEFIDAHLDRDLTLSEIAGVSGLSMFHFSRSFKASTGLSPYKYLLHARAERGKRMLLETSLPIAEIARRLGFTSPSHFSKTFSEICGLSPRAFRRQTLD